MGVFIARSSKSAQIRRRFGRTENRPKACFESFEEKNPKTEITVKGQLNTAITGNYGILAKTEKWGKWGEFWSVLEVFSQTVFL